MAQYRLAIAAKTDIAAILATSRQLHGEQARVRYRALLRAALRRVASEPLGPLTTDRADLEAGVRSFHIRHSRRESGEAAVVTPKHVVFYYVAGPGPVLIVRALHERMDPRPHIGAAAR
jgi:toxin ParE1/3/4